MQILMALAILPSFALMMYIRRMDKIEAEPKNLIIQLLIFGGLTVISAIILELLGGLILSMLFDSGSTVYTFLDCFFVIAASEELGKLVVLRLRTWKDRNFNYTYDAIVYAVAVSLGFATVENVMYVFAGGVETAILRAFTSIPGHTIFAVFMGCQYGAAKRADAWGEKNKSLWHMALAFVMPVILHGFYDFTLMVDSWMAVAIFFVFYITVLIIAFLRIRKMSREDIPIGFFKDAGVQYAGNPGDYIGANGAELMRQNVLPPEPPKPPTPPQQPNQYNYTPPQQNIYGYTRPQQPAPQQNNPAYSQPRQTYQHPTNPYGYTPPRQPGQQNSYGYTAPQQPQQNNYGYTAPQQPAPQNNYSYTAPVSSEPALFQDNFPRPAQPFSQVQPVYVADPTNPEMPPLDMPNSDQ